MELFNGDFRGHFYFSRVAKIWNELTNSVVMVLNIKKFYDQLNSEEVSRN